MTTNEILALFLRNWHVWTVGAIIAIVSIGFVLRFTLPALRLGRSLAATIEALATVKAKAGGETANLDEIAKEAMSDPRMTHLWTEYAETLHPQRADDGTGVMRIKRWRATTLAACRT